MTPPSIPSVVRHLSGNDDPQLVWTNERGGLTFRAGNRFVKWSPRATGLDLEAERLRLAWAIRWHSVPRVLDWGATAEAQWMVTAALPGASAVTEAWLAQPLAAARAIGRGLRLLHDTLPVAACPFAWSVETRTGHRIPVEHLGMPPIDRLVVCHGDACSPNTIITPDGSPAGHVDLGSLGVADRWADLAVASMNLDYNFGPNWEDEFFKAYGIERDAERIAFYRFLWENEDTIGVLSRDAQHLHRADGPKAAAHVKRYVAAVRQPEHASETEGPQQYPGATASRCGGESDGQRPAKYDNRLEGAN